MGVATEKATFAKYAMEISIWNVSSIVECRREKMCLGCGQMVIVAIGWKFIFAKNHILTNSQKYPDKKVSQYKVSRWMDGLMGQLMNG